MDDTRIREEASDTFWAPGTVRLEHMTGATTETILHPVPTSDPDDPLNWSTLRKAINFGLVCFFVLWTFVNLDIGSVSWGPVQRELGFTVDQLNDGVAISCVGLAVGCVFFMPFVHKYGRRPLYILSSTLQLASVIWQAKTYTFGDRMGSNLISGLGGAISEAIIQLTIADIFFVHQHGTMNALFLAANSVGASLGPVAAGFIVESQGWRWMWWWCVIFLSVNLLLVIFFFEESKYIPVVNGRAAPGSDTHDDLQKQKFEDGVGSTEKIERVESRVDRTLPRKTYRQRHALITPSEGSIVNHFYQPVIILFTFPAVAYAAVTYGIVLACFALLNSVQAVYLPQPPYNFASSGVGLMSVAPFIGSFIGFFAGGLLNDKSILFLSRRNGGVYEPEMRLWVALGAAILLPGGILMFGLGLVRGMHWSFLAVGYGIFGFSFVLASSVALSYVTDCYQEIIGDALVGVVFVRNILSVVVLFALTPWINGMGVQNMFILTAVIVFVILSLPVPLLIWGKKARISTAKRYRQMAMRQPVQRTFEEQS